MIPFVQQLEKDKLTNYIVSTNDSKFDDVKTIIGDDFENGKPYLITNSPVEDGTYIQNGRKHTVLGMEYDNQTVGYQMSYGTQQAIYRIKNQGAWKEWQTMTINYYLPVNQDFDTITKSGTYWFNNGSSPTGNNKPTGNTGFLEVIANDSGTLITQRYTNFNGRGLYQRGYYNNNWSAWISLIQDISMGTEFETGRIIDGKKEYGIEVDCGSLPNNTSKSKSLPITLSQVNITKIETLCKSGSGVIQNFEFYSGFNGLYLSTSQNVVTFATKADGSAYNLLVTLYYTKN